MDTCQKCDFAELRFSVYHGFWLWSNTELGAGGFTEIQKCGNTIFRTPFQPVAGLESPLERFQSSYAEHREDAWCVVKKGDDPRQVQFLPGQLGRSSR